MNKESEIKRGVYSKAAVEAGHGACIYSTPDGELIEVTAVIPMDLEDWRKAYAWPDAEDVGDVCKCVRTNRRA